MTGTIALVLAAASLFVWFQPPAGGESPAGSASATGIGGRNLFHTRGCVGCHSIEGVGGSIGPDLAKLSQSASTRVEDLTASDYVRQSIQDPGNYVVPGYPSGLMPVIELTQQELDALVEFLLEEPGGVSVR